MPPGAPDFHRDDSAATPVGSDVARNFRELAALRNRLSSFQGSPHAFAR
jgi:hypothetical protein